MHRPLSPHLQIYKPQLTTALSIMHRITGIFLCLGLLFLVYWIRAITFGGSAFVCATLIFNLLIVKLIAWACVASAYYHCFNGMRYLMWSMGCGYSLDKVYASGYTVIALTIAALIFSYFLVG